MFTLDQVVPWGRSYDEYRRLFALTGDDLESGTLSDAELPILPFADAAFDLALCSHCLFLYSTQLDETFHRAAIRERFRLAPREMIVDVLVYC
jgi:hypothetical protein